MFLTDRKFNQPLFVALAIVFLSALGFLARYYLFPSNNVQEDYNVSSQNQSGGITVANINYYSATTSDTISNVNYYFATTSGAANSTENILSPKDIEKSLTGLAPHQRQAVASSYSGQSVTWRLFYFVSDADWVLALPDKLDTSLIINCDVGSSIYPELKVMNHTDVIYFRGDISTVEAGKITLKECKLTF